MALLTSLKLVSAQGKAKLSPVEHRRNNLSTKLLEQIEMAKAQLEGRVYAPTKSKYITNEEGQRIAIETTKRVKAWWWATANGKLNLSVRYGAKVIELAKGKNAVEVADLKQVVETLELINQAVMAGELDAAIEAVSSVVRKGAK
jgi:hypothetical protein